MSVSVWFKTFCDNIRMDKDDLETIRDRYRRITKSINQNYYNSDSDTAHSLYVGSFGRATEIHTSDIDMLVELPWSVYNQYDNYRCNGQSSLLQAVKEVLAKTYSTSKLKGDGQIISIPFSDGINFEILPAFKHSDGTYAFANANDGGSWKITDPKAEIGEITDMNDLCNKNLKRLCRMTRAWRYENDVEISGILIDIFAYNFISKWEYNKKSYLYYDYMSRDFFKYLSERDKDQKFWKTMGSDRMIERSGSFEQKALTAFNLSKNAIEAESKADESKAIQIWRTIYGSKFSS